MSDAIITVDQLGKKYRIQHQTGPRYTALRDVLAEKAASLFSRGSRTSAAVSPSHEDFWALRNISFEVKPGEVLGIIGRNGAGKSTLLKILSRITEPTEGEIRLRGRVASLLEVGTGFHPELTGRENIQLNGAILGMSRLEIRRKFDEIVAFAEVEKFLDTAVKYYSSGMYMRLAFAVAAHLEPEILIVDEVLAVGDAQFQKKCLGKMQDVAKGGRTVLFVSHNLAAIASLCNRVLALHSGHFSLSGPPSQVIHQYLQQSRAVSSEICKPWGPTGFVASMQFPREDAVIVSGAATEIKIHCAVNRTCPLHELALIIESQEGQRIGLIDFRVLDRPLVINPDEALIFSVHLDHVSLVPGHYSAKLWAFGSSLNRDFPLGDFEVIAPTNGKHLSLYQPEINGIVQFQGRVTQEFASAPKSKSRPLSKLRKRSPQTP